MTADLVDETGQANALMAGAPDRAAKRAAGEVDNSPRSRGHRDKN
jgi:hypothetical protein